MRRCWVFAVVAMLASGFAYPTTAASAAKPVKVAICHYDADVPEWKLLSVSEKAVAAHLRHGDGFPGHEVPVPSGQDGYEFDGGCVPVPAGPTSETIGPAGGVLETDGVTLSIPAGAVERDYSVTLRSLPTPSGLGDDVDLTAFSPVGGAFEIDAPFIPIYPMTLDIELPNGGPWAVAMRFDMVGERLTPGSASRGPVVEKWLLVPFEEDADTVTVQVTGPTTVQLVQVLSQQSLQVVGPHFAQAAIAQVGAGDPPCTATAGWQIVDPLADPKLRVCFEVVPTIGVEAFVTDLESAFDTSRTWTSASFSDFALGDLWVKVANLSNNNGEVPGNSTSLMELSHELTDNTGNDLRSVFAHEHFHLVQNLYENFPEYDHPSNGWFTEGTAEWAMDEVYDNLGGYEVEPDWIFAPLNTDCVEQPEDCRESWYQNVAFFKWLEDDPADAGVVREAMLAYREDAKTTLVPQYLDAMIEAMPILPGDTDFLDFAYDLLFAKDFDGNESGEGELWHADSFGPDPGELAVEFAGDPLHESTLTEGSPPTTVVYSQPAAAPDGSIVPHLTLFPHVLLPAAGPEPFTGTLHVRFDHAHPGASALVRDESGDIGRLDDLGVADAADREIQLPYVGTEKVFIVIADTAWEPPPGDADQVRTFTAWVEPVEEPPDGAVEIVEREAIGGATALAQSTGVACDGTMWVRPFPDEHYVLTQHWCTGDPWPPPTENNPAEPTIPLSVVESASHTYSSPLASATAAASMSSDHTVAEQAGSTSFECAGGAAANADASCSDCYQITANADALSQCDGTFIVPDGDDLAYTVSWAVSEGPGIHASRFLLLRVVSSGNYETILDGGYCANGQCSHPDPVTGSESGILIPGEYYFSAQVQAAACESDGTSPLACVQPSSGSGGLSALLEVSLP